MKISAFFLKKRTYTNARIPFSSSCSLLFTFQWPPPPPLNDRTFWITLIVYQTFPSLEQLPTSHISNHLLFFNFRSVRKFWCWIHVSNKDWKHLLLTSRGYARSQFSIPNCNKFLVRFLRLFQKQKPSKKPETFKNRQSPFPRNIHFRQNLGKKAKNSPKL